MGPQLTTRELDVRNATLLPNMHVTWARYPVLRITRDMLEIQTTTREQSFNEQLYWFDIKRVCIVSNRRDRSAFFAKQQGLF